jgi:hypothetical protein
MEFVTDAMQTAATRWERRINVDLMDPMNEALGNDEYFVEFTLGGLMRGDMKSRYDAYAIGRNWGWLCPDTICEMEGMNPLPDGKGGQEYLRPLNMVPAGTVYVPAMATDEPDPEDKPVPGQTPPTQAPPPNAPDDEGEDSEARAQLLRSFAIAAGRRVAHKEVTVLRKALSRDPATFLEEAAAFYETHQALVAETMCISSSAAGRYVGSNMSLLAGADPGERASALDWIEDTAPEALANLALGVRRRELQETSR